MRLRKYVFLLVLSSLVCIISCNVKSDGNQTNPNNANSNAPNSVSKSDNKSAVQNVLTGTYLYKTERYNNEFKIEQISENQIRVAFSGSTEYKMADGEPMSDAGETKPQIVALDTATKTTGVLAPEGEDECRITLKFSKDKLQVEQEGLCGFGAKVSASGSYKRTNTEVPVFGEEKSGSPSQNDSQKKPMPIRFSAGKNSATVSGEIKDGNQVVYTIDAKAEQTIELKITSDSPNNDIVFSLESPDGSEPMGEGEYGTVWKGRLPKSGTYKILVGTIETTKAKFSLTVKIQ